MGNDSDLWSRYSQSDPVAIESNKEEMAIRKIEGPYKEQWETCLRTLSMEYAVGDNMLVAENAAHRQEKVENAVESDKDSSTKTVYFSPIFPQVVRRQLPSDILFELPKAHAAESPLSLIHI